MRDKTVDGYHQVAALWWQASVSLGFASPLERSEVETNTLSDSLAFSGFQQTANDSARSCAGMSSCDSLRFHYPSLPHSCLAMSI